MSWWIDLTVDEKTYRLTGAAREEFVRALQRTRLRALKSDTRDLKAKAQRLRRRIRRLEAHDRRERQLAGNGDDTPEVENGDSEAVSRMLAYETDDGWCGR